MLASWAIRHNLTSLPNVRFAVQMPRIFQVWRGLGKVGSFGEMLSNFFEPLFLATIEPESESNVALASFLKHVYLFDSVDDEVIDRVLEPSSLSALP